ncbi:MAG: hypothetical protein CVU07_03305 [Bacteroidetes bacterium HGW-Bacteroidetes-23]|nr:MAG: hypothetical protein CVU07_03305 [Bacteroidetes bacterium HGW-Bacteroidetes-23]
MKTQATYFISGIVVVLFITLIGFFKPYLGKFPSFESVPLITHLHFVAFLSWFVVLIWQPILIRQKKFETHRKVGRLTYFLVPILVVTIIGIVYHQLSFFVPGESNESVYINMLGGSLSGTSFVIYYIIAMINTKNTRQHIAFVIASSLVLLNPGLSRMVALISDKETGLLAMITTPFIVLLFILLYEKFRLKKNILKSPYALIFLLFALELILFINISQSEFWRNFVEQLAKSY